MFKFWTKRKSNERIVILSNSEHFVSNWIDVTCILHRQNIAQMSFTSLHEVLRDFIYRPLLQWDLVYKDYLMEFREFMKLFKTHCSFLLTCVAYHCSHLLSIRVCCFVWLQGNRWLNYICIYSLVTIWVNTRDEVPQELVGQIAKIDLGECLASFQWGI